MTSTLDRFSLTGRTAIVTGASSGFGVSFARTVAEAGAYVVLAARRVDKLQEVAAMVESYGIKALVQGCDVTDSAAVARTVANAWETFGRVDVLVNNAVSPPRPASTPVAIPRWTFCRHNGHQRQRPVLVLPRGRRPPAGGRQGRARSSTSRQLPVSAHSRTFRLRTRRQRRP